MSTQSELRRSEVTLVNLRRTATIRDTCGESWRLRNSLCSNGLLTPRRMRRIKSGFSFSHAPTTARRIINPDVPSPRATRPFRIQRAANPVRSIVLGRSSNQSRSWTTKNDRGRTNFGTCPFRIQCAASPVRSIALSRSLNQSRPWTTKNDRGRTNFGTRPWSPSP
jgi:hypothetical protein